jgi:hypothetical protein
MNTPDYLTLALFGFVCIGSVAIGCWAFKWLRNRDEFWRGYIAGRNEERSHTNSLITPARMDAFKKGRIVERANIFWTSRN